MIKRSTKKYVSILLALAFLFTILPMVPAAQAADNYRAATVPSVLDGEWQTLGTVYIEIPGGVLKAGDSVNLRLPSDFEVGQSDGSQDGTVAGSVYQLYNDAGDSAVAAEATVKVSAPDTVSGKVNEIDSVNDFTVQQVSKEEFKITMVDSYAAATSRTIGATTIGATTIGATTLATDAAIFKIEFPKVLVDSGFSGDIELVASTQSGSTFPTGSVVIGRVVTGNQKVEMTVLNAPSFSDNTIGDAIKIRVAEKKPGALDAGLESITLKLPSEFKWMSDSFAINKIWGNDIAVSTTDKAGLGAPADGTIGLVVSGFGDDELKIALYRRESGAWVEKKTTQETAFDITANVEIDNENDAESGDVVVSTTGSKSDVTPSELTIGSYGQYESTIEAVDAPQIYSGQVDSRIGKIVIKESVKGSLVAGRTIILTLSDNARWTKLDNDSDNGVTLEAKSFPGSDGRSVKWVVSGGSTNNPAELALEDMEIATRPGTTGDIKVEVSGTAGLTGTLVVAKAVAPVSITASSTPTIGIGSVAEVGDLTIKEAYAGAIDNDKDLIIDLPEGVRFAGKPTVKVTEGNIDLITGDIRTIGNTTDDNQLIIPVDSKSSVASTITISGIKVIADRTVPEGDLLVKVQGSAVAEVNTRAEVDKQLSIDADGDVTVSGIANAFTVDKSTHQLFPNTNTAAKAVFAKIGTPAAKDQKANAQFKIGSTTYTVNGVEQTMDVAPYMANGRTYLPIRYLAYALGIEPANILFDGAKGTVTLMKNGTFLQVTLGSKVMIVNGVSITMDVAPEMKAPGRAMLPFRWIAQAFGAQVDWNEADQTVSVN